MKSALHFIEMELKGTENESVLHLIKIGFKDTLLNMKNDNKIDSEQYEILKDIGMSKKHKG